VRHEVAVVRVEVRNADEAQLLIEVLEVGREPTRDRLLGRTTNAADACRLLERWLDGLGIGCGTGASTAADAETDR
jgi:hypothetical protein